MSSLIEKFEQLEDIENGDVKVEVSAAMQSTEGEPEEEVEAAETLDSEEDDEEEHDSDEDEELGSTFDTSADSFTESPESSRHYA